MNIAEIMRIHSGGKQTFPSIVMKPSNTKKPSNKAPIIKPKTSWSKKFQRSHRVKVKLVSDKDKYIRYDEHKWFTGTVHKFCGLDGELVHWGHQYDDLHFDGESFGTEIVVVLFDAHHYPLIRDRHGPTDRAEKFIHPDGIKLFQIHRISGTMWLAAV